jgi:hypothetical protein
MWAVRRPPSAGTEGLLAGRLLDQVDKERPARCDRVEKPAGVVEPPSTALAKLGPEDFSARSHR